nr:unnamed protein product [Digitaria exilis]
MILCRVVQLLLSDASVILYIKKARVPLSDSDGVTISAEDIVAGDKELILSLLWNAKCTCNVSGTHPARWEKYSQMFFR